MKQVKLSIIFLCIVFSVVIINSYIIHIMLTQTIRDIEKIDIENSEDISMEFTACYERFEKREHYLSLTVSHSDLTDIDDCFAEIIGSANVKDTENIIITKNRLINSIEHLRRLSGINLDSILFICTHSYLPYRLSGA